MELVSTFAVRLKEALGDTMASTLADDIGLSKQAISMYTTGKRIPKRPTIKAIAEQLNVNAAWLSGYDVPRASIEGGTRYNNPLSFKISHHETKVITAYHHQPEMQPAVDRILKVDGITSVKPIIEDNYIKPPKTYQFTFFNEMPASAGLGTYAIDIAYAETIDLTSPPPRGATYMIRVTGDSMAPTINDNDKVFVKSQPAIEIGEIGIFIVNNEVYIKELGRGRLISHNEAYEDIVFCEYDEIICKGKFLGVYK